MLMYESYHLFRTSLDIRVICRVLGGCGGDGGFIVEAVEITSGFLEILDPFLGLDAGPAVSAGSH